MASVGLSPNDFGPLFLLWDNSGVDNCDGGNGVKIIAFWSVILRLGGIPILMVRWC